MAHAPIDDIAIETAVAVRPQSLGVGRQTRQGFGLLAPAILVALLFSLIPLAYLVQVSLTEKSSFFFTAAYTLQNYETVFGRYLSTVRETVFLALMSTLLDLIFGYPFAYILIRKVRYREFVRTMMTFPLFGTLYLAFGLFYLLLPTGPFGGLFTHIGINVARYLFSLPATLFGMMVFTFPFMVMNVGAALSNVDPMLEEAAKTLGAKSWQTFVRILFPLSWSGILAGFLMCFGWNLGVFAVPLLLGRPQEQNVLSIAMYDNGLVQFDYGLAAAMGVVLMVMAFTVSWVSLRFSRGALGT